MEPMNFASSMHEPLPPVPPRPDPVVAQPTIIAKPEPDRITLIEHDTTLLKQRLTWHIAAWWVLFALLLVSWFAFGAWGFTEARSLRGESVTADSRLDKRIDEKDGQTQNRLDARTSTLDQRVDQLLRDMATVRAELSVLQTKVELQEAMCQNACAAINK